ncbi:MAG: hypothetical protein K0U86_03115 [Planctomycetes bacterium]|nr:hypothetical protein [Planctomycetota bacterium]MCH9723876.1 hypothetical protein [Planctomycetota bacterium]MCH9778602.1 hypothetical protein [Planctomycetota bacterium]MCH9792940.1 hypothetical protein [Planctomycetota bacterium]
MVCTHLKELYQLCEKNQLRIGGTDLVHIICKQCEQEETCPSTLMDEYDSKFPEIEEKVESKPGTDHSG